MCIRDRDLLAALILEGFLAEQVDVDRGAVVQLGGHNTGADSGAELDLHPVSYTHLPFSRIQLADYLNCDRSALSRELSLMQRDGLLDTYRSSFKLLEPEALRQMIL